MAGPPESTTVWELVYQQLVRDVSAALEVDVREDKHRAALESIQKFAQLPLVPPWDVRVEGHAADEQQVAYLNTISGEEAARHPGLDYLIEMVGYAIQSVKAQLEVQRIVRMKSPAAASSSRPSTSKPTAVPTTKVLEFMSWWKELSIEGLMVTHQLLLTYNLQTGHFRARIDDSSLEIEVDKLDGKYGIVEAVDLFVGATIVLFGKKVTLMKANTSTTQWIERQAEQLSQSIQQLRKQLYTAGIEPVQIPNRSRLERRGRGAINLRLLRREVDTLQQQWTAVTRPQQSSNQAERTCFFSQAGEQLIL